MAGRCTVCAHDSRAAIEQALMNGKPKSAVARQFGFTYTRKSDGKVMGDHKIMERHADKCMGEAFRKAIEDRELASGEAMLARLRRLEAEVDTVIERAQKGDPIMSGDIPLLDDDGQIMYRHNDRVLLAAVREARANVELMAKLAGKVEGEPVDLDQVRAHLQTPEARRLIAQLEELQAQTPKE